MNYQYTYSNSPVPEPKRSLTSTILRYVSIVSIAFLAGYIHYHYVSNLFENDRNFSYLSEMERELSLRTEMGFYYSYYKTVVEVHPFMDGITNLTYDRLVEFPTEVNAFNRFNIYPEFFIAATYRLFQPILNTTAYRQCHMVDRGGGLASVESCVGLGQPIMFYLEAVWIMAGLNVAALFLQAIAVSDSVLGGLFAVIQYFANHAESTRVQWAPNERENMAGPLVLLQLWLVSLQLRDIRLRNMLLVQVGGYILTSSSLLYWQFSQFIFLTQLAILFLMQQLRIINLKILSIMLHSHFTGLHTAVLLLQGNDMLKSSLYASFFIVLGIYCLFFGSDSGKIENRMDLFVESLYVILRIGVVTCSSIFLKKVISYFLDVNEDTHIWDLLRSKFTNFRNFHTQLYTCSEVFDFLPMASVIKLCVTLLIPFVLISVVNVVVFYYDDTVNYTYVLVMENDNTTVEEDGNSAKEKETESTKDKETVNTEVRQTDSDLNNEKETERKDKEIVNTDVKHKDLDLNNEKETESTKDKETVNTDVKHKDSDLNNEKETERKDKEIVNTEVKHKDSDLNNEKETGRKDKETVNTEVKHKDSDLNNEKETESTKDKEITNTEVKQTDSDLINSPLKSEIPARDEFIYNLNNLKIEPAIFYNIAQMIVYGFMAGLFMRLKLLFVPQMCVVAAIAMNKKYYVLPAKYMKCIPIFWLVCMIPVLYNLKLNVSEELSHVGEFNDLPQEKLMQWITSQSEDNVYAGSLPLLASILLVTRRAVVAHPHYEHENARKRAYAVYKTYGRFTSDELFQELSKLRATHLVVEHKYCYGKSSKGCTFLDLWDAEVGRTKKPALCHTLLRGRSNHLYPVYRDGEYVVFKVHEMTFSYMPRSFEV